MHAAEIEGPYILMPHSISGLYSIYYANTYPEEVAGIIGIDCTLPKMAEYFGEEYPEKMPLITGQLCSIGVMRLITLIEPDNFISDNSKHYYSDENLTNVFLCAGLYQRIFLTLNRRIMEINSSIASSGFVLPRKYFNLRSPHFITGSRSMNE